VAGAAAGDPAVSPLDHPQILSGQRGLCQSGTVPSAGAKKVITTPLASRPMPFWSGKSSTCSAAILYRIQRHTLPPADINGRMLS